MVEHPTINPPALKIDKPGRPKMNRRRETGDASKRRKRKVVIHCKFCHDVGHNQASCPKKPENQGKRRKKRPISLLRLVELILSQELLLECPPNNLRWLMKFIIHNNLKT